MSYLLNGSTDYFQVPDLASVGDFTFACKFNWGGVVDKDSLWNPDNYPASPRSFFVTSISNQFASPPNNAILGGEMGGVSGTISANPLPPSSNVAHDMVVVRSGGNITYYLDGASYATTTGTGTGLVPLLYITLGSQGLSQSSVSGFFGGTIWQAGLWLSAWNATDINEYHTGNDPTSIEWSTARYYLPLLVDTHDVLGSNVTVHGTPSLQGTPPTLAISSLSSVVAGSTTILSFVGANTPWSKGSAKLVATAGSVITDTVISATERSTVFTAPASAGTVTFTDFSTGATTHLTVTVKKRRGGQGRAKLDFPLPGLVRSRKLPLDTPLLTVKKY